MGDLFLPLLRSADAFIQRLPSIPYGPELYGYWGPITSTINWCECDYYLTPYCAEVINSFTNIIFVYLALRGIRNTLREGHDTIFLISFLGYLMVGLGSFAFHSTLWYSMQLVDELSMVYTTSLMVWATFSHQEKPAVQVALGFLLAAMDLAMSLVYHYLQDPTFHQAFFAIMMILLLLRCFYTMEVRLRKSEPQAVNRMWRLVGTGVGLFLGGFVVWNLDNIYCAELRQWREKVGLPWGALAEGHGWWHLLTGVGSYYELVYGICLRVCLEGRQDEYKLDWSTWAPVVRRWRAGEKEAEEAAAEAAREKKRI